MSDALETELRPIANGCAMDQVLKFLSREWLGHIVRALGQAGVLHFGARRCALPDRISARMLAPRLKELQALDAMLARFQAMVESTPLPARLREPAR